MTAQNRDFLSAPYPFDHIFAHRQRKAAPPGILAGNNIIDIDCGCGNRHSEHRRLARLRLDDMEEFNALVEYKRGLRENVSCLDCR